MTAQPFLRTGSTKLTKFHSPSHPQITAHQAAFQGQRRRLGSAPNKCITVNTSVINGVLEAQHNSLNNLQQTLCLRVGSTVNVTRWKHTNTKGVGLPSGVNQTKPNQTELNSNQIKSNCNVSPRQSQDSEVYHASISTGKRKTMIDAVFQHPQLASEASSLLLSSL